MQNYPTISQTYFNDQLKDTINARDLHAFLQSKRQYTDWIKTKLNKVGFKEGIDYLLHKFVKQVSSGAKHLTEYFITVETAKQISLMENTEVGYQYRLHLIARDDELKAIHEQQTASIHNGRAENLDHVAKATELAEIRLALRLHGKQFAIDTWNKSNLGLTNPIKRNQKFEGFSDTNNNAFDQQNTEAAKILMDMIKNPPYPALLRRQVIEYLRANCSVKIHDWQIASLFRQARIPTKCFRHQTRKTTRLFIFTDEKLKGWQVWKSVDAFDNQQSAA